MTARWRILGKPMEFYPEKAVQIVKACVALHNFLLFTDAANIPSTRYSPPNFSDSTTASHEVLPGEWRHVVGSQNIFENIKRLSSARASRAATATRNDFKSFFMSPLGKLPWQDHVIQRGFLN